jgi:hypothetical protein
VQYIQFQVETQVVYVNVTLVILVNIVLAYTVYLTLVTCRANLNLRSRAGFRFSSMPQPNQLSVPTVQLRPDCWRRQWPVSGSGSPPLPHS